MAEPRIKRIVYLIDVASGGVDFFLWGAVEGGDIEAGRAKARISLDQMVAAGWTAEDFQIGSAIVPADYEGEFVPRQEEGADA